MDAVYLPHVKKTPTPYIPEIKYLPGWIFIVLFT